MIQLPRSIAVIASCLLSAAVGVAASLDKKSADSAREATERKDAGAEKREALSWASAFDLATIDRRISKEPPYQGKPKYCLVVFGPKAEKRVWLVLDGDVLYVDRNGNGDLTEPGKRLLQPTKKSADADTGEVIRIYDAGEVSESQGKIKHQLQLQITRESPSIWIYDSNGYVFQHTESDHHGDLRFAGRPQEAPIIHFHGPLALTPRQRYWPDPDIPNVVLARGNESGLMVRLGTPGLGKGTFAFYNPFLGRSQAVYPSLPNAGSPVVEIAFPSKQPDGKPIQTKVALHGRC
jgi:hypothetical protein